MWQFVRTQWPVGAGHHLPRRLRCRRSTVDIRWERCSLEGHTCRYWSAELILTDFGAYPVVKFAGISRASNSYCKATCTAYFAKATEPSVATLGLMPAIPAIMK